jgi:hypothetical protein
MIYRLLLMCIYTYIYIYNIIDVNDKRTFKRFEPSMIDRQIISAHGLLGSSSLLRGMHHVSSWGIRTINKHVGI